MDDFDAAKQMIVAAMGELEGMRAELSALTTNVEDVKAMLDDALRSVCGLDVVADADRLIEARESKKELDKQQRIQGKSYDF
jgi:hypothetical protein